MDDTYCAITTHHNYPHKIQKKKKKIQTYAGLTIPRCVPTVLLLLLLLRLLLHNCCYKEEIVATYDYEDGGMPPYTTATTYVYVIYKKREMGGGYDGMEDKVGCTPQHSLQLPKKLENTWQK
jgi:hypothetical protein